MAEPPPLRPRPSPTSAPPPREAPPRRHPPTSIGYMGDGLDDPPPFEPPSKKKGGGKTVLLLVIGVPLGLIALVATLGLLYSISSTSLPVTPADRAALITIDDLVDWMEEDYDPASGVETVTKTRFIDRTYDLVYEFENVDEDSGLYFITNIGVENTESDAGVIYKSSLVGLKIGLGASSVTMRERPGGFKWGDVSVSGDIMYEGVAVGSYFVCRDGKRVFSFLISGLHFDDDASLREMLEPKLRELQNYKPE